MAATLNGGVRIAPVVLVLGLVVTAMIAGCAGTVTLAPVDTLDGYKPAPRGYYRVLRGDTLIAVARRTGQSVSNLAAWNHLRPPYRINSGRLLQIAPPGSIRASTGRKSSPHTTDRLSSSGRSAAEEPDDSSERKGAARVGSVAGTSRVGGVSWQWPLAGTVKQGYKAGNRSRQGIRIQGAAGGRVGAAASGTVVYSGSGLKGYGNLIIVKHNDQFLSVYGFNRRLIAQQGEKVRAGQVLAEVGQEVSGGDYVLHFEIRRDGSTVDPRVYLPRR